MKPAKIEIVDNTYTNIAALKEAISDIESGERKNPQAIMILFMYKDEDNFNTGYITNGRTSDLIALLEAVKIRMLRALGLVVHLDDLEDKI